MKTMDLQGRRRRRMTASMLGLAAGLATLLIPPEAAAQTTFVAAQSTGWEYYVPIGNEPANDGQGDEWTSENYNPTPADWTTPAPDNGAPYHFGTLTGAPSGTNLPQNRTTYYARKTFNVTNPNGPTFLSTPRPFGIVNNGVSLYWTQDNAVDDIAAFAGMVQLREVDLVDNRIADLAPLAGLRNL